MIDGLGLRIGRNYEIRQDTNTFRVEIYKYGELVYDEDKDRLLSINELSDEVMHYIGRNYRHVIREQGMEE